MFTYRTRPDVMPLSPSHLIATANGFVGIHEEGGANRGQVIEIFLKGVKQPAGQPWCAAFVHHVGYWSHYDVRTDTSSWPLPATASCWELGEFARRNHLLHQTPRIGDVFLKFDADLNRFAHAGIVTLVHVSAVPDKNFCSTIEGNTNVAGSREGTHALRKERGFSIERGDRFIRWYKAQQLHAAA